MSIDTLTSRPELMQWDLDGNLSVDLSNLLECCGCAATPFSPYERRQIATLTSGMSGGQVVVQKDRTWRLDADYANSQITYIREAQLRIFAEFGISPNSTAILAAMERQRMIWSEVLRELDNGS